jgi:hypothetical protein
LGRLKGHKEVAKSFCPKGQKSSGHDKKGFKLLQDDPNQLLGEILHQELVDQVEKSLSLKMNKSLALMLAQVKWWK